MKFARILSAAALLAASTLALPSFAQEDANCSIFYAGQDEAVGSVCVTIDADIAYLDYFLENGWTMSEAHAWIGDTLSDLPQNQSGNPQIGLFPFTASGLDNVTEYSVAVPVSELQVNLDTFCSADIFVAAHGVVHKAGQPSGDDTDDGQHSSKSTKGGYGSHSSKSGKSGYDSHSSKSGKSGYDSHSSKSGKGGYDSHSSKSGKSGYDSHSSKSGKSGYDSHSSKSGKGGYDSHSSKSGKGYSSSGSYKSYKGDDGSNDDNTSGGGRTESAWAGEIEISEGGSWASYFSFTNDFCAPVEIAVPQGCYNTFMQANTSTRFGFVSSTPFSPIGTVGTTSAWVSELANTSMSLGTLLDGTGTQPAVASVNISTTSAARVVTFNVGTERVLSSNIYYGPAGSFQNVSPLEYGYHADNLIGASAFSMALPLVTDPSYDLVVHAVVCSATNDQ